MHPFSLQTLLAQASTSIINRSVASCDFQLPTSPYFNNPRSLFRMHSLMSNQIMSCFIHLGIVISIDDLSGIRPPFCFSTLPREDVFTNFLFSPLSSLYPVAYRASSNKVHPFIKPLPSGKSNRCLFPSRSVTEQRRKRP